MLDKYKKYKKESYKVSIVKPNCYMFEIVTDLDLDDKRIFAVYRQELNDMGLLLLNYYKYPVPTLLTRIILFLQTVASILAAGKW